MTVRVAEGHATFTSISFQQLLGDVISEGNVSVALITLHTGSLPTSHIQGLDNETETLANVGGFTSICLAANLQSEVRVDQ